MISPIPKSSRAEEISIRIKRMPAISFSRLVSKDQTFFSIVKIIKTFFYFWYGVNTDAALTFLLIAIDSSDPHCIRKNA
jgi:hypothetical protein